MSEDTIQNFLTAPTEKRLKMALDDSNAEALKAYLGKDAYNEDIRGRVA